MKIINKAITLLFLLAPLLASCNGHVSPRSIIPTDVMETPTALVKTEIVETLIAASTSTLTFSPPTPSPIPTQTPSPTLANSTPMGIEQVLLDFALSQDETKVAVYTNQEVFVYDFVSHEKSIVKNFKENVYTDYRLGRIALSPDGTQLAISGIHTNESIEIWSLESFKLLTIFSEIPEGYQVQKIDFTPNGKNILARIS
jgi:WD40 repeat protein